MRVVRQREIDSRLHGPPHIVGRDPIARGVLLLRRERDDRDDQFAVRRAVWIRRPNFKDWEENSHYAYEVNSRVCYLDYKDDKTALDYIDYDKIDRFEVTENNNTEKQEFKVITRRYVGIGRSNKCLFYLRGI